MLNAKNRLKTRFQYNITRNKGTHYKTGYFHIFVFKPKMYDGPPQIGIVVSNKVHKKAVHRNRIKRLFREAVKLNLDRFSSGYWVVIQPTRNSLEKSYEEICSEIDKAIQEISFTN